LIFDPRMSRWTSVAQLLGEVALCGLIIWKVPCELISLEFPNPSIGAMCIYMGGRDLWGR
jgi:hypothetical protein